MIFKSSHSNVITTVTFWPTTILIHTFKNTHPRITLSDMKKYNTSDLSCDNLHIYNVDIISDILKKEIPKNTKVLFGLRGQQLQETSVSTRTKQVTSNTFDVPSQYTHDFGYQYLYPHTDAEYMFYVWSIPHYILFLYRLLAQQSGINLIGIIPYQSALFQAYQRYTYPTFRTIKLAVDMTNNNHSIESYFKPESAYRLITNMLQTEKDLHLQYLHAAGLVYSLENCV